MAENEVLKATTEIKIHELRRHDGELSKQYDEIDDALERVRGLPVERLRTLFRGVEKLQVAQLANALAVGEKAKDTPSVLVVVTDVEFFGPSVSHEVVLGILVFLGVTDPWLRIFESHMKMPPRFPDNESPQLLAKGVPASR